MATVLLVLAAVGVTIYAALDCVRSDDAEIRSLPKPLWLLLIVGVPLLGGTLWILLGRQPTPGSPGGGRRLRTIGPDDDPDFLSSLQLPRSRGERRRPDTPSGPAASGPSTPSSSAGTSTPDDDEGDPKPS